MYYKGRIHIYLSGIVHKCCIPVLNVGSTFPQPGGVCNGDSWGFLVLCFVGKPWPPLQQYIGPLSHLLRFSLFYSLARTPDN